MCDRIVGMWERVGEGQECEDEKHISSNIESNITLVSIITRNL